MTAHKTFRSYSGICDFTICSGAGTKHAFAEAEHFAGHMTSHKQTAYMASSVEISIIKRHFHWQDHKRRGFVHAGRRIAPYGLLQTL
jgi:hypothetical protein